MANPKVTYTIESRDNSGPGLKDAENHVSTFGQKAGAVFKGLGVAALAVMGVGAGLGAVAMKLVTAFGESQKSQIKLTAAAFNNPFINGDGVKGLIAYSEAMQKTTIFEDDMLQSLMAIGVNMGYTQQQIQDVTSAAINLASSTGEDIGTVFDQLYKTLQGIPGRMSDSVKGLKNLTEEQLKAGEAIKIINQQYAGMGVAVAKGVAGVQAQFRNMISDLQENLGKGLAPAFMAIQMKLKPVLESITNWVQAHSKQIANFFLHLPEIAAAAWQGVVDAMKVIFTIDYAVTVIKAIFTFLVDAALLYYPLLFSATIRLWQSIWVIARDTAQSIWEVLKSVGMTAWFPLKYGFEMAIYGIKVAWRAAMMFFAQMIDWVVNSPINALAKAFNTVVWGIGEGIKGMINGIVIALNAILTPLDYIIFKLQKMNELGAAKGALEKYTPGGGGLSNIQQIANPLEGFDPKKWKNLENEAYKKWEYVLTPPENTLAADITEEWSDIGARMSKPWDNFVTELNGIWNGFDNDLKKAGTKAWAAIQELAGSLSDPLSDAFNKAKAKINALLNMELPPDILALLNAALDKAKAVVDATPVTPRGPSERNLGGEGPSTAPAFSWWNIWMTQLGVGFAKIGASLSSFADSVWEGIKGIGSGIANAAVGIWNAVTNPIQALKDGWNGVLEAIGEGGVRLGWSLQALGQYITDNAASWLDQGAQAAGSALQWLFDQLMQIITASQAFQDMLKVITDTLQTIFAGPIAELIIALQPLIDIILVLVNNVATALIPIFQMLGSLIVNLKPLWDILGVVLMQIVDIITILAPIIFQLAQIIGQILIPIFYILSPILDLVAQLFKVLAPIIAIILKGFVYLFNYAILPLVNAIIFVLNVLYDVVAVIWNAIAGAINAVLGWLGVHVGYMAYRGATQGFMSPISETTPTTGTTTTAPATTKTQAAAGTTTADYSVKSFVFNVTVNTDIIATDSGIPGLVKLLYNEFQRQKELGLLTV